MAIIFLLPSKNSKISENNSHLFSELKKINSSFKSIFKSKYLLKFGLINSYVLGIEEEILSYFSFNLLLLIKSLPN